MKIYALMENTAHAPGFQAEHGLSLYVETDRHRLLFDTGQSGAFADNAEKLGIDLGKVDSAFLSHGHYDHGGGLRRFFALNDHAPVYLSRFAFGAYHHGSDRYIGLDRELLANGRLVETADELRIDEELSLDSCNGMVRPFPTDSAGLTEKVADGFLPDAFLHEQYLTIRSDGKRVLLSGCSHKGILNIVEWLKPDILIGGFHFMNQDVSSGENGYLDHAAELLKKHRTEYHTCHCTGVAQYAYLKKRMGEKLHYLSSGQGIEV
ncbi:MAG: MBL fold metallo-hydrolase [Christensenellales bacterium]|jgi:7,8-dihydropterin-6-yl-methyl-4-(beta-D-ribofuranosyl)aminobenzene 5'-phosphate synthase